MTLRLRAVVCALGPVLLAAALGAGCTAPPSVSAPVASHATSDGTAVVPEPEIADTETVSAGVRAPREPRTAPEFVESTREPWRYEGNRGHRIMTPNYDVYTTISYEGILDRLPLFLERALVRYTGALSDLPGPPRRLETYIFRNRQQWTLKTREVLPYQASTFENLGRGGFTTRGISVLYYIDWRGRYRDTFAICAHEGWHQYTQSTFRQNLPIWLEEGIATYMEGFRTVGGVPQFEPHWNGERRSALRDAFRSDGLIPLRELIERAPQSFLEESKDKLLTYYAQVWALTLFLADGADGRYRDGLAEVLDDAAEGRLLDRLVRSPAVLARGGKRRVRSGRTGPWVLYAYFTTDFEAFEEQYLAYARELARRYRSW